MTIEDEIRELTAVNAQKDLKIQELSYILIEKQSNRIKELTARVKELERYIRRSNNK